MAYLRLAYIHCPRKGIIPPLRLRPAQAGSGPTIDHQRAYYVDAGSLKSFDGAVLRTGLSAQPMYWTEINDQVFYSNGLDSGIIQPGGEVLDWDWVAPATPAV